MVIEGREIQSFMRVTWWHLVELSYQAPASTLYCIGFLVGVRNSEIKKPAISYQCFILIEISFEQVLSRLGLKKTEGILVS